MLWARVLSFPGHASATSSPVDSGCDHAPLSAPGAAWFTRRCW
jgi:hypothetical protein